MGTDLGDSSSETPNKRIKIEESTLDNSSTASLLSVKGKVKLESEPNRCGICLSEEFVFQDDDQKNSVSRGCIDSCDHYFCFVCIMEWAKVESKCPLCKRRFSTILRPAKPPVFPSDRVINVPVRDQVYHHYGNATIGPPDPYSETKCSICQSSVDECLLLLCDLCDSASHTYCVGLGMTVPEGDWFCHDCTLVRDEHKKEKEDTDSEDEENSSNLNGEPVSVFDIVREPSYYREVGRSSARLSIGVDRNNDVSHSRTHELSRNGATNLAARTLRQCRNVHDRIKVLRDNWNSIRNGSLSFSSRQRDHGHTADSCVKSGPSISSQIVKTANGRPLEPESIGQVTSSSQKANSNVGYAGPSSNRKSEISGAWKMMNMAKSIERRRGNLSSKRSSPKHVLSNPYIEGTGNLAGIRKEANLDLDSVGMNHKMLKSRMLERQNLCNPRSKISSTSSAISFSPINCQFKSSHIVRYSIQRDIRSSSDQRSYEKSYESPHTGSNHCESSMCVSSLVDSAAASSNVPCAGHELPSLLSCKEDSSMDEVAEDKIPVHPKSMRNDDSKSEIQSLVKLNLKLLTKTKKLEIAEFKQVARSATHSILIACGLEYPKAGIRQFSSCICYHDKSNQQFHRSTLMPNSCRECFFAFVKDVVKTIMLEKIGNGDVS